MGVTTSNRKRSEECMSVNHQFSSSSDYHRKKPKFSSESTRPVKPTYDVVSRISRYPDTKPPFVREVHAPCRPKKFNFARTISRLFPGGDNKNNDGGDIMGNFLTSNYEKAKHSALEKCRVATKKEKVVIDLDAESSGREVSEDSGVVEVVEIRDTEAEVVEIGVKRRLRSSPDSALTNTIVNLEEYDLSSVHVYKKLLEGVQRRTDTIRNLNFQIELNEKRRDTFQLLRPKKELVEVIIGFLVLLSSSSRCCNVLFFSFVFKI